MINLEDSYTMDNMVDYVKAFIEQANNRLPTLEGLKLHINQNHEPWYKNNFHEKYGKNAGYFGLNITDPCNIIWVPYMKVDDYRMWLTKPIKQ